MKEIPLTKGKVTLVDDKVAQHNQWSWSLLNGYAARYIKILGKKKSIYMHREIVGAPKGLEVDHINGNKLDNRRENLRICTHSQNVRNMKKRSDNTSKYKGVSWNKHAQKYTAEIHFNREKFYLGCFNDPEEAARAYDEKAHELHGVFARTNFSITE